MIYLFYIVVFVIVGMIIGLIFLYDDSKAYSVIIGLSILWSFVMGPWGIAAFIEMVIGYSIVESNIFIVEAIGELIVSILRMLLGIGIVIGIAYIIYESYNGKKEVPYISPKEQCKKDGNIWMQETSQCHILYSLTIHTNPLDARVRIMNIKPKYYNGIRLDPGRYDIMVDKYGYYSERFYVDLHDDSTYTSKLQKKY